MNSPLLGTNPCEEIKSFVAIMTKVRKHQLCTVKAPAPGERGGPGQEALSEQGCCTCFQCSSSGHGQFTTVLRFHHATRASQSSLHRLRLVVPVEVEQSV